MSCNDSSKAPVALDAASADVVSADTASADVASVDRVNDGGASNDAASDDVSNPPLDGPSEADAIEDARIATDSNDADGRVRASDVADAQQDAGDARVDADDAQVADVADAREAGPDAAFFSCCGFLGCHLCDRRIQICDETRIPGGPPNPCLTLDGGSLGNFPAACVPEPNCACIRPFYAGCGVGPSSTWYCSEDAGAVILSCNGCYGAPPVRLERLLARPTAKSTDAEAKIGA